MLLVEILSFYLLQILWTQYAGNIVQHKASIRSSMCVLFILASTSASTLQLFVTSVPSHVATDSSHMSRLKNAIECSLYRVLFQYSFKQIDSCLKSCS